MHNKLRCSSTIKKSAQDLRAPTTATCQPHVASQRRHKTKENFGTEDKKNASGDWIKFTFLALQKKQSYSQQNNIHDPFMARIERK